jgi:signal peptidase I
MTAQASVRPAAAAVRNGRSRALRVAERGSSVFCGLAVALLASLLVATAFGYHLLIDHSDSMRPTIRAGDLLITHAESARTIRVGQIVAFVDPALRGRLVTHRVVRIDATARSIAFVTRGDANSATERWSVARRGSVDVLDLTLPAVGRPIAWVTEPWVRTTLMALLVLILSTALLGRIWRS